MRGRGRFAAMAVMIALAGCGSGDERAIRRQLSAIEESLTVPAQEGDLARVARIAGLRRVLAADIRIATGVASRPGAQIPPEVAGRDAVLALAGRGIPPSGGVALEFVDTKVTLDDMGTNAEVYGTAKITAGTSESPVVDAREVTIGFAKIDGDWVVSAVRPEDTFAR